MWFNRLSKQIVFGWMGLGFVVPASAEDWNRFRGANGSGVATDATELPTKWSPTENLAWKTKLPGPGSSSPIIVGERAFVTCWSGYGTPEAPDGKQADLKRHLVCIDCLKGTILWDKSVPAVLPEDQYNGMFAEHGYASHTPASDGKSIYAFFGKSGLFCFDMEGNQKWQVAVGDGLDERQWGSSCSPLIHGDKVIVLASAESQTLYAFDTATGKQAWKNAASNFNSTWGTPVLAKAGDKTELVVGVPGEIWGFHADTGKFLWYCPANEDDSFCSSVIVDKDIVYAIEGRSGAGIALRVGGKDDVSQSNVVWKNKERNRIGTPVLVDGKIFFFIGGVVNCIDAKTGEQIFRERLPSANKDSEQDAAPERQGRGRGGPMGGQDYSSAVSGDGKVYYVNRKGDMHVLAADSKFQHLGVNRVTHDAEDFSSTPAISGKQILVRSDRYLYCIRKGK